MQPKIGQTIKFTEAFFADEETKDLHAFYPELTQDDTYTILDIEEHQVKDSTEVVWGIKRIQSVSNEAILDIAEIKNDALSKLASEFYWCFVSNDNLDDFEIVGE